MLLVDYRLSNELEMHRIDRSSLCAQTNTAAIRNLIVSTVKTPRENGAVGGEERAHQHGYP